MANDTSTPDLMKRLSLVYSIASLYRAYGRRYDMFLFNRLVQLVCGIPEKDIDRLMGRIVMGKLNPAYFDTYAV